ncbi:MAG: hypothetical protein A3G34_09275 [Candidatus Lindowbacteria bacterium RIFCSPLOWO2_12_FULL_62_27]|nr:MAG: hypothetical protein A3I06_07940 [Candidatus Lindowbacteria bacterium RIFCSPLOWO2_02_FULL_62_12]OGH60228.1 MAG: hypothetical protein A3G34_09275 [Candidatus Lindowbacteria bacterium RIFCSPLOWO2_12_FULL_62_27]
MARRPVLRPMGDQRAEQVLRGRLLDAEPGPPGQMGGAERGKPIGQRGLDFLDQFPAPRHDFTAVAGKRFVIRQ